MKELCIRRDRKYCNVIQQEISLFKQRFSVFLLPLLRQPTECTLDYNIAESARMDSKKIKYYECFMFRAKFERRDASHVWANKYRHWETSFDYKFMNNCWRRLFCIVQMKLSLILIFNRRRKELWLIPKWANERKCLLYEWDKHESPQAWKSLVHSLKSLFRLCFAIRHKKSQLNDEARASSETNKIHIKSRCDSVKHETVCVLSFVVSSTHFRKEMQSTWN